MEPGPLTPLWDPWHPRATTPSAPLPQGDALVAYPNLRQEKKCAGKKSGYEVMRDINVVNA